MVTEHYPKSHPSVMYGAIISHLSVVPSSCISPQYSAITTLHLVLNVVTNTCLHCPWQNDAWSVPRVDTDNGDCKDIFIEHHDNKITNCGHLHFYFGLAGDWPPL